MSRVKKEDCLAVRAVQEVRPPRNVFALGRHILLCFADGEGVTKGSSRWRCRDAPGDSRTPLRRMAHIEVAAAGVRTVVLWYFTMYLSGYKGLDPKGWQASWRLEGLGGGLACICRAADPRLAPDVPDIPKGEMRGTLFELPVLDIEPETPPDGRALKHAAGRRVPTKPTREQAQMCQSRGSSQLVAGNSENSRPWRLVAAARAAEAPRLTAVCMACLCSAVRTQQGSPVRQCFTTMHGVFRGSEALARNCEAVSTVTMSHAICCGPEKRAPHGGGGYTVENRESRVETGTQFAIKEQRKRGFQPRHA